MVWQHKICPLTFAGLTCPFVLDFSRSGYVIQLSTCTESARYDSVFKSQWFLSQKVFESVIWFVFLCLRSGALPDPSTTVDHVYLYLKKNAFTWILVFLILPLFWLIVTLSKLLCLEAFRWISITLVCSWSMGHLPRVNCQEHP